MNPLSDWEGKYVKITITEVYKGRVLDFSGNRVYIEGPNEVAWVHLADTCDAISTKGYSIQLEEPPMKNGYWHVIDTNLVFEYRDGEWFYLDGNPLPYTPDAPNGFKYLGSRG